MKKQDWENIIAWVGDMIDKEVEHNKYLRSIFKDSPPNMEIAQMIALSDFMLNHFIKRKQEYIVYMNKNYSE